MKTIVTTHNFLTKKNIRSNMRKLMKCMDYTLKKAEAKKADPIYFNIYQMLGGYAWGYFCEHCKHEFKVSKKYPSGRCIVCGKIRYPNEN